MPVLVHFQVYHREKKKSTESGCPKVPAHRFAFIFMGVFTADVSLTWVVLTFPSVLGAVQPSNRNVHM